MNREHAVTAAADPLAAARTERDSLFQRELSRTGSEHEAALAVAEAAGVTGVEAERVARVYLELRKTAAGESAA